jgi:hypothetical protein
MQIKKSQMNEHPPSTKARFRSSEGGVLVAGGNFGPVGNGNPPLSE